MDPARRASVFEAWVSFLPANVDKGPRTPRGSSRAPKSQGRRRPYNPRHFQLLSFVSLGLVFIQRRRQSGTRTGSRSGLPPPQLCGRGGSSGGSSSASRPSLRSPRSPERHHPVWRPTLPLWRDTARNWGRRIDYTEAERAAAEGSRRLVGPGRMSHAPASPHSRAKG